MVKLEKVGQPESAYKCGITFLTNDHYSYAEVRTRKDYKFAMRGFYTRFKLTPAKNLFGKSKITNNHAISNELQEQLLDDVYDIVKDKNEKLDALRFALEQSPYASYQYSFIKWLARNQVARCLKRIILVGDCIVLAVWLIGWILTLFIDLLTGYYCRQRYTEAEVAWINNVFTQHPEADYDAITDSIVSQLQKLSEKYSLQTGRQAVVWTGVETIEPGGSNAPYDLDEFLIFFDPIATDAQATGSDAVSSGSVIATFEVSNV